MDSIWQHVLVSVVAMGAAGWLIRNRMRRNARGSGCAGCPSGEEPPAKPPEIFVPISSLRTKR